MFISSNIGQMQICIAHIIFSQSEIFRTIVIVCYIFAASVQMFVFIFPQNSGARAEILIFHYSKFSRRSLGSVVVKV